MRILDANLLIYAFDELSPQHHAAASWLRQVYAEDDLVGVPRLVTLAFLRITTNPRIMRTPASVDEAMARVQVLIDHPKTIVVEPGANHWPVFKELVRKSGAWGPSLTDANLASLAVEHGATLCSADQGFRRYAGLRFENPLENVGGG